MDNLSILRLFLSRYTKDTVPDNFYWARSILFDKDHTPKFVLKEKDKYLEDARDDLKELQDRSHTQAFQESIYTPKKVVWRDWNW